MSYCAASKLDLPAAQPAGRAAFGRRALEGVTGRYGKAFEWLMLTFNSSFCSHDIETERGHLLKLAYVQFVAVK